MIVTRAPLADVDTIMVWRRELTAWLAGRGVDQWSIPLPRTAVAATVGSGQTWIVHDNQEPVATITLTAWSDVDELWKPDRDPEVLWYPANKPADALYAAKMMVPRARAGGDLGAEMLDWASGRAYDSGLTWLRLAHGPPIQRFTITTGAGVSSMSAPSRATSQAPASNARLKTDE